MQANLLSLWMMGPYRTNPLWQWQTLSFQKLTNEQLCIRISRLTIECCVRSLIFKQYKSSIRKIIVSEVMQGEILPNIYGNQCSVVRKIWRSNILFKIQRHPTLSSSIVLNIEFPKAWNCCHNGFSARISVLSNYKVKGYAKILVLMKALDGVLLAVSYGAMIVPVL